MAGYTLLPNPSTNLAGIYGSDEILHPILFRGMELQCNSMEKT